VSISYSQQATIPCSRCKQIFDIEAWTIVAADERPDLMAQIRAGTLHRFTCPHCSETLEIDAPILIFQPTKTPPLLFSPAQGTTRDQDETMARDMLDQFREDLGTAWQDAWLGNSLPGVPRQLLPEALNDLGAAILNPS
jgi:hypothetical protein